MSEGFFLNSSPLLYEINVLVGCGALLLYIAVLPSSFQDNLFRQVKEKCQYF